MKLFRWNARATQLAQRNNMPIYYTIHTAGMLRHKSTTATWYVQYTARGRRRAELRVVVEWTGGPSTVPAQSCMPPSCLALGWIDAGAAGQQAATEAARAATARRAACPPDLASPSHHQSPLVDLPCRAPRCAHTHSSHHPLSPLRHDLYSRDAHTTPMIRSRPAARALRRSISSYPQHPSSFLEQCRLSYKRTPAS
jgi:hypothetical protein